MNRISETLDQLVNPPILDVEVLPIRTWSLELIIELLPIAIELLKFPVLNALYPIAIEQFP